LEEPSPQLLDSLLEAVMVEVEGGALRAMYVVERLGEGTEGAWDLIAAIINDERWPRLARTQGLRRLAEVQHDAVLQLAEQKVVDADPLTRSSIAEALGKLDDPAVIPYLEGLLADDSRCADMWAHWRVMDEAARSLARWRDRSPAYDAWVEDRLAELGGEGRDMAAISLGYVRHVAAIPPLVEAALSDDEWALELLGTYRSREVSQALCAAVPDAEESARSQIAYALGKNGDPHCIPMLARMLAEGPNLERFAAARGLRWLEHEDARRVLAEYRDDPDPEIRAEVALAENASE
jgi:HEAT repeat protein